MSKAGGEKPTSQERALAEIGAKNFARFQEKFAPIITKTTERARAKTSDLEQGAATVSAQFANNAQPLRGGSTAQATTQQAHGDAVAQAAGTGESRASSRVDMKAREMRGLVSAAALGRGIADQGTQGLAAAGQQAQALTQARSQNAQALRQGLVSAAATGAGAYAEHKYGVTGDKKTPPLPGEE